MSINKQKTDRKIYIAARENIWNGSSDVDANECSVPLSIRLPRSFHSVSGHRNVRVLVCSMIVSGNKPE